MVKVVKNVIKCSCGSYLKYSDNDITQKEYGYSVGTYYGETYTANIIHCPICHKEIEV
jgi:hypothetical protein